MIVPSVLGFLGQNYSHDHKSLRCHCMILTLALQTWAIQTLPAVAYNLSVLCEPGGMMDGQRMLKTCQIDYDVHASFLKSPSRLGTRRLQ